MKNRSIVWGAVCIAAGIALAIVTAILWGVGVWDSRPGASVGIADTMERHFLEQMIPHHEGAVEMAELALTRAEHPALRQLAETIIRDQTREIEQMQSWYLSWYGVEAPAFDQTDSRDGMMGGRMMGGMMGGMMGDEADLEILMTAPSFDKEFIRQMVPHHQMGVMMAQMVRTRSDRPEIEELAQAIISTQTAEIEQMRDWYGTWFD